MHREGEESETALEMAIVNRQSLRLIKQVIHGEVHNYTTHKINSFKHKESKGKEVDLIKMKVSFSTHYI